MKITKDQRIYQQNQLLIELVTSNAKSSTNSRPNLRVVSLVKFINRRPYTL